VRRVGLERTHVLDRRANPQTHLDAVASATMMAGKRNADGFGNVLAEELGARSESAGRQNNLSRGECAVARFYSHHSAAGILLEPAHRRAPIYPDILFPLHS